MGRKFEVEETEVQWVSVREAVREIQKWLTDCDAHIAAEIERGRSYWAGPKLHYASCSTLQAVLWATRSEFWVDETSDRQQIQDALEMVRGVWPGGGWMMPGKLLTREEAGRRALKRCRTCAPDVTTRPAGMRSRKVATLDTNDLGRLLDGSPIEAISHERGVVTVRTSAGERRFGSDATVTLPTAAPTTSSTSDQAPNPGSAC